VRKAMGIFDRVFGVDRSVRLTPSYRPAYLLSFLLIVIPYAALAQEPGWWTKQKADCGVPAGTAYNDWVKQNMPCNKSSAGSTSSTPSVPAGLTPQQQLAMQGAAVAGNMIGQALGQLLFGSHAPPPVPAQPDPGQQQRVLAAQQLNNSGLYLLKQKNYSGAINEFQKALATNPNDSNSIHNLAMAKQQQKDAAVAGQTSGALGQFLGNAPANTGLFGFAQLTGSTAANPNPSALSLVNLDSDANVVDLRGTTKTSVDPESLKDQLDGVLGSNAPVSEAPGSQVVTPQDKDMELLSTLSQPGASQSQVVPPQDKDMELLSTLSQPGASQSKVVLPQDKDMELLSTLSQSGASQSKVVPPQDKDMELLGFPPPSGRSKPVQISTPGQTTPAYDSSLKDGPNENQNQASKGTGSGVFGTSVAQPTLAPADQNAGAVGRDTNANHQANALARSEELLATNPGSNEAGSATSRLGFDTGNKGVGPVNGKMIQTPPNLPADIQIPGSLTNNPQILAQMRVLNLYKQQAQDARTAAAAAQAKFEAAQKQGATSDQLTILKYQAQTALSKAGNLDSMVTVQTGEVRNTIKFAKINTGGNGSPTP
jgi:tetratricopeptide (TPR) repeat protein